jgi:hypothetical protein
MKQNISGENYSLICYENSTKTITTATTLVSAQIRSMYLCNDFGGSVLTVVEKFHLQSISSTFYVQPFSQFLFCQKKLQTQNLGGEKLLKTLLFKKVAQ